MAALVKRDAVIAKETARDNRVKCIVERKKVNKRAVETKNKQTRVLTIHLFTFSFLYSQEITATNMAAYDPFRFES
jgi:hypothetical protein